MKRLYSSLLSEYLQYFPCVAIIGPRQCGKTTLLKELPAAWKRFDLEKDADHQAISRDPGLFLRLNPENTAMDEAQLLPDLFRALRVAIDGDRQKKGRFVLTGSSSPALTASLAESLAGRVGIIEMAPFTAAEAMGHPNSPLADLLAAGPLNPKKLMNALVSRLSLKDIQKYWLEGGYPEPWIEKSARFKQSWREQYVRTYLERDVARLFPGLNRDRFRSFIRQLAGLSGTIINQSDVARALGVSQPTARDYFEIAHGSFIWRTLPAFDRKTLKRLVRHSKGYMRDSGILHHLLRIPDADTLMGHPAAGHSWEGMVIENILRGLAGKGVPHDAFHYRTGAGAEIDLILEGDFGILPVEIKLTQMVELRSLRAISDFVRDWKCPVGIIINNDEKIRFYDERIVGVPFSHL